MDQFPHLNFAHKIEGKPRIFGGGSADPRSIENKSNRRGHGQYLESRFNQLQQRWVTELQERDSKGLPQLDEQAIPFFIQINPNLVDADFSLIDLGIEIISEEEDGFIIGASLDSFRSLQEKIRGFVAERYGTGILADFWEIIDGDRTEWRPSRILSSELFSKWREVNDDALYTVEVGIAFDRPITSPPDATKKGGQRRLARYEARIEENARRYDDREEHFLRFVSNYGRLISSIVNLTDSFACEIEITGLGLKDLVVNYPFVFEVAETETAQGVPSEDDNVLESRLEIVPPSQDSVEIAVVDSGVLEGHRYLSPAITISRCYLPETTSCVDEVRNGGHGTRVAGAILFPNGPSQYQSPYQLPFRIRNLRILDRDNALPTKFPASLLDRVFSENENCSIFNLSVCSISPFRLRHMSTWAARLDLAVGSGKAIIVSAGNVFRDSIKAYLDRGDLYPAYLNQPYCRIANPAQSCFSITVGSINQMSFEDENWTSVGRQDEVSCFSRIGLGMWGQIKPDVVEFGGGLVISKTGGNHLKVHSETSPELVRSTADGGGAIGKDAVGTSFAAPKVANIIGHLRKLYPDENVNLLRALLIQGARLPGDHFFNPTIDSFRHFGYGVPSLARCTTNTENRVSFYNSAEICAEQGHVYSLKIPESLRDPGNDLDILIEVTVAFTAQVRRTRQRLKSYLSSWVDWESSKLDEPYEDFREFILKEIEQRATKYDRDSRNALDGIPWKVKVKSNTGVLGVNRSNNTVQKDWAILKSYSLPSELSIAVRGRKGWDGRMNSIPYAIVISLEVLGTNIPIYEQIRVENQAEVSV